MHLARKIINIVQKDRKRRWTLRVQLLLNQRQQAGRYQTTLIQITTFHLKQ